MKKLELRHEKYSDSAGIYILETGTKIKNLQSKIEELEGAAFKEKIASAELQTL